MMFKTLWLIILAFAFAVSVSAQHGGKAEPNRIHFAKGKTSTVLAGVLSRDQEAEYVFGAKGGQVVTVTNSRSSAFDFRIFSEEADVETEFESSRTLTLTLPQDGDYFFFVRKKAGGPRSARYSMTISIK